MGVKCFLVKYTDYVHLSLRVYSDPVKAGCPARPINNPHLSWTHLFHENMVPIGYRKIVWKDNTNEYGTYKTYDVEKEFPDDHPIWDSLKECTHCHGYRFFETVPDADTKQHFDKRMMVKVDSFDEDISNLELTDEGPVLNKSSLLYVPPRPWWKQDELPEGAMWQSDNWDYDRYWDNQTEPALYVVCPGGTHWNIDSRANNCTMPNDKLHRCWVREGIPPNITAGKSGNTCNAGAGSIATPNYHGFLRNGEFTNSL